MNEPTETQDRNRHETQPPGEATMRIAAARAKRQRRWIAVGLGVAIVFDTVVQLVWKYAALRLPDTMFPTVLIASLFHEPTLLVLGAAFAVQLINWLVLLERADLSYVQPFTSLSYVSVAVCSLWLLGEPVSAHRAIGIVLVLVGVFIFATDAPRSARRD